MTTSQLKTRRYQSDHTIGMDDIDGRSFRNLTDLTINPGMLIAAAAAFLLTSSSFDVCG